MATLKHNNRVAESNKVDISRLPTTEYFDVFKDVKWYPVKKDNVVR